MKRGFLLIDQHLNTYIISTEECLDLFEVSKINLHEIHKHKRLGDLQKDIKAYLNSTYGSEVSNGN